MPKLTLPDFVNKWQSATLTERAGAQMHFIELCDVLGEPHPAAEDHSDETYTFEKGVTTTTGGQKGSREDRDREPHQGPHPFRASSTSSTTASATRPATTG